MKDGNGSGIRTERSPWSFLKVRYVSIHCSGFSSDVVCLQDLSSSLGSIGSELWEKELGNFSSYSTLENVPITNFA